jgi:5-methylcytosine-specific restriction protein B
MSENNKKSFLLSWNPKKYSVGGSGNEDYGLNLKVGDIERWSCNTTQIKNGDDVYLIRLGVEPRGIVIKGVVVKESYKAEDWAGTEDSKRYIDFRVEDVRMDCSSGLLPMILLTTSHPEQAWSIQSSGIAIKEEVSSQLDVLWNSGNGKHSLRQFVEWTQQDSVQRRSDWLPRYVNTIGLTKAIIAGVKSVDDTALNEIWKEGANGVSTVAPGFLSNIDFDNNKGLLRDFTERIVKNSGADTMQYVRTEWEIAKNQKKFRQMYNSVINRAFASIDPSTYTTIVNAKDCRDLLDFLNESFQFKELTSDDWITLNAAIKRCMAKADLQQDKLLENNIGMWQLLKNSREKPHVKAAVQSEPIVEPVTELPLSAERFMNESPTNLILYGPPGTGKTFELAKLSERYVSAANPQSREQWLMDQLRDERWIDVVIMAMHSLGGTAKVADIVAHEFVVLKAQVLGRIKNVRAQIWASLQKHTVESSTTVGYAKRFPPYVFDKQEDSVWHFVDGWQDECDEQIQRVQELSKGPVNHKQVRRYDFVTFHQAYSYEDFVEGIRPIQDEENGELVYRVMPGVFKRICDKARLDSSNRYAIFIDEINRGNIARIFGELITLIEIDKRARYDEASDVVNGMSLTLPYSGESFSVPANLDIYGSMNTADRSIALLDTALRRRFNFRELMPDSRIITGSRGDGYIEDSAGGVINLRALLDAMNRRIRFLLNRDLMLGHAYLCKVRDFAGLRDVLLNQLVPLLQEYFYNDWHRIQLVFRDIGENDKRIEPQIIVHEILSEEEVLGFDHDDFEDLIEYRVATPEDITPDAIRKIYE